jgi:hypothetical protein
MENLKVLIKTVLKMERNVKRNNPLSYIGAMAILVLIIFPTCIFTWSGNVHQMISEYSLKYSIPWESNLFLKLNLDKGKYDQKLNYKTESKTIMELISMGAILEDESAALDLIQARSGNHFHNPLKNWEEAGLTDIRTPVDPAPLSSILWAQDAERQSQFPEFDNSWKTIRNYYFVGLTAAFNRDYYLSRMFKGLGHQIHLIQDMAVPDHVRNDSHPLNSLLGEVFTTKASEYRCIEGWAKHNPSTVNSFIDSKDKIIFPDLQLTLSGLNSLVSITKLTDSNAYFLGGTPSISIQQGLAEYTNSNYFSEDTIFSEGLSSDHKHYSPFPQKSSTNLNLIEENNVMPKVIMANDGRADWSVYVNKVGDGEIIDNFIKLGYFGKISDNYSTIAYYKTFIHDKYCHQEYASKLIPRAVGYSAAMINYFFRGALELSLPEEEEIYGFAPYPEAGFNKIALNVKNVTPNENMENGRFTLVVRYRNISAGSEFDGVAPPTPDPEQKFVVSEYQEIVFLASNEQMKVIFNLPEPLPVNAADVALTVVFKGDLGAEKSDGVALGFKDISEPTAIEIYNDTGMVCFNGNTVEYTNPDLIFYADQNHDGVITKSSDIDIIPRTLRLGDVLFKKDVSVDKGSNTYFNFLNNQNVLIDPGNFYRMYVLADEDKVFYFSFLIGQKRFEDSQVLFSPLWTIPYYDCKYVFMDYHYFLVSTPNKLPASAMKPRVNKLLWKSNLQNYEPYANNNSFWAQKNHYYFNLFYYSQPNNPDGCACLACDTYKPAEAQEFKAFHYPSVVVCDYFIDNCMGN